MADPDLRLTHELDARYFRELDRTLRGLVARMESRRDLFAEEARLPTDEEEAFLLDGDLDRFYQLYVERMTRVAPPQEGF